MYEIERKFLVHANWPRSDDPIPIAQGYLAERDRVSVRIRRMGERYLLSVKCAIAERVRHEFEYPVPAEHGEVMLRQHCAQAPLEKHRHCITYEGRLWEIDEFHGANAGLVVAEVELPSTDAELVLPPWVGQEVSDDLRYLNTQLALHPYSQW